MRKLSLAVTAVALLATPALAVQQGPARQAKTTTLAELQSRVEARFARTDINRDGFVSQTEAKSQLGDPAARAARKAVREQRTAKKAQRLARLDANRDGVLSAAERPARAAATTNANQAKRAEHQAMRTQRRAERQAQAGKRTLHINDKRFARIDANKDARLSLAEVTAQVSKRFQRLDANRDGALSREERRTVRAQRQARKA